jgi:hypothetical protein
MAARKEAQLDLAGLNARKDREAIYGVDRGVTLIVIMPRVSQPFGVARV